MRALALDVMALLRLGLPLRAPGRRFEPVGKVLNLVSDLSVAKFHDADGGDGPPIVKDDVFDDPEVSAAERTLHLETSPGGVLGARFEYVATAVEVLAGLRILELDVVAIDLALRLFIPFVGRGPVAIECGATVGFSRGVLRHGRPACGPRTRGASAERSEGAN